MSRLIMTFVKVLSNFVTYKVFSYHYFVLETSGNFLLSEVGPKFVVLNRIALLKYLLNCNITVFIYVV